MSSAAHRAQWFVGSGFVSWPSRERRSDRYGGLFVLSATDDDPARTVIPLHWPIGCRIALVADVISSRPSIHPGDVAGGMEPVRPQPGDRLHLGIGTTVAYDHGDGWVAIGLLPDDGRPQHHLDPQMLWRIYNQFVRLEAIVCANPEPSRWATRMMRASRQVDHALATRRFRRARAWLNAARRMGLAAWGDPMQPTVADCSWDQIRRDPRHWRDELRRLAPVERRYPLTRSDAERPGIAP